VVDASHQTCTKCTPGHEPNPARDKCVPCGAGNYSSFGVKCQSCKKTNVINDEKSSCTACPAGKGPNKDNTDCVECTEKQYSIEGTCQPCAAPNVVDESHQTCESCPPGKEQNLARNECVRCVAGKYSRHGSKCESCITPFIVSNDQTDCNSADGSGSYDAGLGVVRCFETDQPLASDLSTETSGLVLCPPCVHCSTGGAKNRTEGMTLRAGYALRPKAPPSLRGKPIESIAVFRCPVAVACLESDNGTRCAEGYDGPLCGTCAGSYGKQKDHTCARCDSTTTKTQNRVEMFAVFAVVSALAFVWYKKASFGKLFRLALEAELIEHCKIVIGFFQVVSPMGDVLALPFAQLMPDLHDWLHKADFLFISLADFVAIDCIIPAFYVVWFCNVFVVPLVLFGLVGAQYWAQRNKESIDARNDASTAAFMVLFLTYPRVSKHLFEIMVCRQLGDHQSVLEVNYSVNCEDTAYHTFRFIALVMVVVVPLGVPAWLIFQLINQRQRHKIEFADKLNVGTGFAEYNYRRLLRSYAMVIRVYRAEVYFYEPFDWLRKMLLGGLLMLLHRGSILQVFVGTCVSFAYGMLHASLRPYRKGPTNVLKLCVELQIFLTMLISMLLRSVDTQPLQSQNSMQRPGLRNEKNYEALLICSFVVLVPGAFFSTTLVTLRRTRRHRDAEVAAEMELEQPFRTSQFWGPNPSEQPSLQSESQPQLECDLELEPEPEEPRLEPQPEQPHSCLIIADGGEFEGGFGSDKS
jgi:hypothetical protein